MENSIEKINERQRERFEKFLKIVEAGPLDKTDPKAIKQVRVAISFALKEELKLIGFNQIKEIDNKPRSKVKEPIRNFLRNSDDKNEMVLWFEKNLNGIATEMGISRKRLIIFDINQILDLLSETNQEKRIKNFKNLCHIVLHEGQHSRQAIQCLDDTEHKDTLRFIQETYAIRKYGRDWYNGNYYGLLTEVDAESTSYKRLAEITGEREYELLAEYYKCKKDTLYFKKWNKNEIYDPQEWMANRLTNEIVRNRPHHDQWKKYKILKNQPEATGEIEKPGKVIKKLREKIKEIEDRKGITPEEKEKLISDLKEMQYDLFYRAYCKHLSTSKVELKTMVADLGDDEAIEIFNDVLQFSKEARDRKKANMQRQIEIIKELGYDPDSQDGEPQKRCREFFELTDQTYEERKYAILNAQQFVIDYEIEQENINGEMNKNDTQKRRKNGKTNDNR